MGSIRALYGVPYVFEAYGIRVHVPTYLLYNVALKSATPLKA